MIPADRAAWRAPRAAAAAAAAAGTVAVAAASIPQLARRAVHHLVGVPQQHAQQPPRRSLHRLVGRLVAQFVPDEMRIR